MPIPTDSTRIETPALPKREAIARELVYMFHQRAPWPLILLNIVLAGCLLLVWWEPNTWQWLWFAAIVVVSGLNILRHKRYQHSLDTAQVDPRYWIHSFTRGVILIGLMWGIGGVLFYDPLQPQHSAVVLLLICGIAAGITASQASLWPTVIGFVICAILPAAIYTLGSGELIHQVVGVLLLFYLAYILLVGKLNHDSLLDAVRLRLDNEQLLAKMAQSEQHFRALVENLPDLLTVISHDGVFLFESPTMERVLGYPAGSMHGKPAISMIHPDDMPQAQNAIELALRKGYSHAELRLCDSKGRWRLYDCVGKRLDDRSPPAVVVNARDTTERRDMENALRQARDEAEQANRVKSQFLATVSHEIRTPMHAILGMAEMLQQTELNPRQREYVNTFQQAGSHLLNLINDILDYSRLDAGGLQLSHTSFDISALLKAVLALFEPQAKGKGITLTLSIDPELYSHRKGDPQRLQQILVNLVSNAIKFTQHGSVHIETEAIAPETVVIAIQDSGCGIPADQLDVIFQPFTQLNSGNTREQGGTGLGLSISRRLVQAMGGEITVSSERHRGSRFAISLPLPVAAERQGKPPAATATSTPGGRLNARILVADDSSMNQTVMSAFLKGSGCTVIPAYHGQAALDAYRSQPPDLIIMDMQMPQMDGGSATRAIRDWEEEQGLPRCPIIALSASAMEEDRQAALAAGCNEFYAKPLARETLFKLLHTYLE